MQYAESGDDGSEQSIYISGEVPCAMDMVSYIALNGEGADTVDIAVYPPSTDGESQYQGWNASNWVNGPGTNVDGYYWYRLQIKWSPDTDYTWYAKTYRKTTEDGKPFRMWAFRDKSAPVLVLPTPPFDEELDLVEGQSAEEWCSDVLGVSGSYLENGTFNAAVQCAESTEIDDGYNQKIMIRGEVPSSLDMVSYIALNGEDANIVDVTVSPYTTYDKYLYQGWDGSNWVDGPATNVDGYFWYRLQIKWSSDTDYLLYAKTDGSHGDTKPFRMWAFRDKSAPSLVLPTPPFDEELDLAEGQSGDEWSSDVLGVSGSYLDDGTFNVTLQCAETGGGGGLNSIIIRGEVSSNMDMVSYIALDGEGADTVDVMVSPYAIDDKEQYQGWDGSDWVDRPATNVDGYYWYRLQIKWSSGTDYTWFAKTYRADGDSKPFRMWAFRDKSASSLVLPTPPFDEELHAAQGQSAEEWCSDVLDVSGSYLENGTFNAALQCAESVEIDDGDNQMVMVRGVIPSSLDMVSYIALDGEGADTVDVRISPGNTDGKSIYQGWDGSNWVDGPATNVDGYFWYRLQIKLPPETDCLLFAKTYRKTTEYAKPFRMWAFLEK